MVQRLTHTVGLSAALCCTYIRTDVYIRTHAGAGNVLCFLDDEEHEGATGLPCRTSAERM